MAKYLIFPMCDLEIKEFNSIDLSTFMIIEAPNKKEAVIIYSKFCAKKDRSFVESIRDGSLGWYIRLDDASNEDEFSRVAISFFDNNSEWSDILVDYYFNEGKNFCDYSFPDDMMSFMFFKSFDERDFKVINLDNISYFDGKQIKNKLK